MTRTYPVSRHLRKTVIQSTIVGFRSRQSQVRVGAPSSGANRTPIDTLGLRPIDSRSFRKGGVDRRRSGRTRISACRDNLFAVEPMRGI